MTDEATELLSAMIERDAENQRVEKIRKNLARELLDLETDLHAHAVEARRLATRVRNIGIIMNPGAVAATGIPGVKDLPPPQVAGGLDGVGDSDCTLGQSVETRYSQGAPDSDDSDGGADSNTLGDQPGL